MENIEWKLKGFYEVDAQKAYEEIQSLEEITDKSRRIYRYRYAKGKRLRKIPYRERAGN